MSDTAGGVIAGACAGALVMLIGITSALTRIAIAIEKLHEGAREGKSK